MSRWLCLLFCAGLALCHRGEAREGYVRTRTGKIIEGHLRFESNAVVVVNPTLEFRLLVPFTNLFTVAFQPDPPPNEPPPEGIERELAPPWLSLDIGAVEMAGAAVGRAGRLRIQGAGTNILGDQDSFHFVHRLVLGDRQVMGRVRRWPTSTRGAMGGLMMRQGGGSDAASVSVMLTAEPSVVLIGRTREGGPAEKLAAERVSGATWLKLVRRGFVFSAMYSADARSWHLLGRVNVRMDEEMYLGVAVLSGSMSTPVQALLEGVEEEAVLHNAWYVPQVEMTGGSVQRGSIDRADDTSIRLVTSGPVTQLPTRSVSAIRFRPVPARWSGFITAGRPGALLNDGQFVEGEVRGIRQGEVTVSSIPLGLRYYDVNSELLALVFRARDTSDRRPCRLTTVDGSVWNGTDLRVERNGIVIRDPSYGQRSVPHYAVAELRWRE